MELIKIKWGENEAVREFLKRYDHAVFDLGAFNYPQTLKNLKERANMVTVAQLEKTNSKIILHGIRQAKRDIEIKDENMARIRSEQLKDLRWKEKKIQKRGEPVK